MGEHAHCVIIRFWYPEITESVRWRLDYLRSEVLPRLLSQDGQDFDIAVLCNTRHRGLVCNLGPRFIPCFIKNERAVRGNLDFLEYRDVSGLNKYNIQTAMDSDDLILRKDYIAKIESIFASKRRSCHLSFPPYLQDLKTNMIYRYPRYAHGGSPFYSLYHPDTGPAYEFIYHDSHLRIGRFAEERIIAPEGYCAFTIHDFNSVSRLEITGDAVPNPDQGWVRRR